MHPGTSPGKTKTEKELASGSMELNSNEPTEPGVEEYGFALER